MLCHGSNISVRPRRRGCTELGQPIEHHLARAQLLWTLELCDRSSSSDVIAAVSTCHVYGKLCMDARYYYQELMLSVTLFKL